MVDQADIEALTDIDASMGPRGLARGWFDELDARPAARAASMGPRGLARGWHG